MIDHNLIGMLHNNEYFKAIIKLAKNDAERELIINTAEKFLEPFVGVIGSIRSEIEKDPEGFKNKVIEEAQNIIKDGPPPPDEKK